MILFWSFQQVSTWQTGLKIYKYFAFNQAINQPEGGGGFFNFFFFFNVLPRVLEHGVSNLTTGAPPPKKKSVWNIWETIIWTKFDHIL